MPLSSAERSAVVNKVQKLLSLAEGTDSEEESVSAVKKAHDLLEKHNLTISDIEIINHGVDGCEQFEISLSSAQPASWLRYISAAVGTIFQVKMMIDKTVYRKAGFADKKQNYTRSRVILIGVKPDAEIAKYVLEYLIATIQKAKGSPTGRHNKDQWRKGFAISISVRLERYISDNKIKVSPHESALVVAKKQVIEQFADAQFPDRRHSSFKVSVDPHSHAYRDGLLAGRNHPLNKPIEEAQGNAHIER